MFKAAKAGPKKIMTANRLGDGRVVFLGVDCWLPDIAEAAVLEDGPELEAALARAAADNAAQLIVEAYPVDVREEDGDIVPVRLRERIRAEGPTVDYGTAELARLRGPVAVG